jgi:hypothetical protein
VYAPSLLADNEVKGTDFVITFIPNYHNNWTEGDYTSDSIYVFIFAEVDTKAQISYHSYKGTPFTDKIDIKANEIYVFKKTSYDFALRGYNVSGDLNSRNNSEKVCNISFRLTTDNSVLVYGHSQAVTTSESFNVLPVMALGKEYLVMAYNSKGILDNGNVTGGSTPSQFAIAASEDNTNVTITPKTATQYNNLNVQNIVLQKGEVYLVQAKITRTNLYTDLTGSEIKSDKPVAVFSGHQRAAVPYDLAGTNVSRDMLIEQLPPLESWSNEALVAPFVQPSIIQNTETNDLVRIMAGFDNTEIYIDGNLKTTLKRGEFLEVELTQAFKVTATSSILVCAYKRTSQTDQSNSLGDPLMQIVPSIDQYGNNYRFIAIQAYQHDPNSSGFIPVYSEHFITIIAPSTSYMQVNLDGNIINPASFKQITGTNYYYAFKKVSEGIHEIASPDNFGLFVCGYGYANSYGYFSGVIVKRDDFEPPVMQSKIDCFEATGNVTDKKVSKIFSQPNSDINTNLVVDAFTPYATDVNFNVSLINKYLDGSIRVVAEDSARQQSFMDLVIPGFTVAVENVSTYPDGTIIPVIADTSANNLTMCKNYRLINYGKYPQSITSTSFKMNLPVFTTDLPNQFVLQPSETKDFQVCFQTELSDQFFDTLRIEGECGSRDLLALDFASLKDQNPPKLAKKADICNHYIELTFTDSLKTDRGIANIVVDQSQNVKLSQISMFRKYAVYSATVLNYYQDAYYTIRAIDSAGFETIYSDTIPGFTVEFFGSNINSADSTKSALYFGNRTIGIQICDSIKIRNYGNFTFTIDDLYMSKNIWFSTPLAQLPMELKPGETKQIYICFRPSIASADTLRDTLKLQHDCLSKDIALSGVADSIKIENGSRCQVNVLFEAGKTSSESFVSQNFPNPGGITTKIKFGVASLCYVKADIYDIYGNYIRDIISGRFNNGTYEVELLTTGLYSGLYFYIFEIDGQKFINTMLIEK